MKRIFIIGYMGVGKTTVGKKLAKLLSLTFVDLDAHIQSRHYKTIPELFAEKGEAGFREIEQQALHEVASFENVVISTGGGAPCFFDNMEVMNRVGTTVYIEATPEILVNRLLASKNVRPLVVGKSREELTAFVTTHLAERERFYKKADIIYHINQALTKEDVSATVEGIAAHLQTFFKNNCSNYTAKQ